MPVTRFSPAGLQPGTPYDHVAIGTGTRHVHISGQVARSAEGKPIAINDLVTALSEFPQSCSSEFLRSRGKVSAGWCRW